jgi:hypothetical protein
LGRTLASPGGVSGGHVTGASPAGLFSGNLAQQRRHPQDTASRTNRTAIIGFRVEAAIKQAAERAAAHDRRSLSSLLEKILIEFLYAHGFLEASIAAGHTPKQTPPMRLT